MSYAVKKDGSGWRSVLSAQDCDADEDWSSTRPATTAPVRDAANEPPQLTPVQITKLAGFLTTNPDIAEALGL